MSTRLHHLSGSLRGHLQTGHVFRLITLCQLCQANGMVGAGECMRPPQLRREPWRGSDRFERVPGRANRADRVFRAFEF